jgi:hypothetical protein
VHGCTNAAEAMDGREQRNPPIDTAKFQEAAPATPVVHLKESIAPNRLLNNAPKHQIPSFRRKPESRMSMKALILIPGHRLSPV